jgi:cbb3-type cytochrome oxidase subunit 1
MSNETTYNYKVVRQFAIMTVVWGIVGMTVGVLIAAQMAWPALNFDTAWLSFGRLRPLHTNAVVFAFGGSALFATSYYVVQRTCHVRLISDKLWRLSPSGAGHWLSCWQRYHCRWVLPLPKSMPSWNGRLTC